MCLGPDNVFKTSGKAFANPFFSPVSGSDNQAKPGVGNLVANPGSTQRQTFFRTWTPSRQHTLGQENYMGAEEDKSNDTIIACLKKKHILKARKESEAQITDKY